jgi:hypothetical protein
MRSIGSYKSHAASHPRRRHSSDTFVLGRTLQQCRRIQFHCNAPFHCYVALLTSMSTYFHVKCRSFTSPEMPAVCDHSQQSVYLAEIAQSLAQQPGARWFLSRLIFDPVDGGSGFLRNVL